jgi:cell division protein FtsZ
MGDEVKNTVQATGFRQEAHERRERMLNAALREPSAPQVQARPAKPKFASEEELDEEPICVSVLRHEVMDVDPIFGTAIAANHATGAVEATAPAQPAAVAVAEAAPEPATVIVTREEEQGENLDIPAFMRRGGL